MIASKLPGARPRNRGIVYPDHDARRAISQGRTMATSHFAPALRALLDDDRLFALMELLLGMKPPSGKMTVIHAAPGAQQS